MRGKKLNTKFVGMVAPFRVMLILKVFWQVSFLASKVPAATPSWIKLGVCHVLYSEHYDFA